MLRDSVFERAERKNAGETKATETPLAAQLDTEAMKDMSDVERERYIFETAAKRNKARGEQ